MKDNWTRDKIEASHWDSHIRGMLNNANREDLIVHKNDISDRLVPHLPYFSFEKINQQCITLLGELKGKRILDCGCGNGFWSTLLALNGATVHSIDVSPASIELTQFRANENGVGNLVKAEVMNAEDLHFEDSYFDKIIGSFVLHHTDISLSAKEARRVLNRSGRAVYIETSARNPLLMQARTLLTGRFGVPKYGTKTESPLRSTELEQLSATFSGSLNIHYVSFIFFRMLAGYIKILNGPLCMRSLARLDNIFSFMRTYSYFMVLEAGV